MDLEIAEKVAATFRTMGLTIAIYRLTDAPPLDGHGNADPRYGVCVERGGVGVNVTSIDPDTVLETFT